MSVTPLHVVAYFHRKFRSLWIQFYNGKCMIRENPNSLHLHDMKYLNIHQYLKEENKKCCERKNN
jgi:hypothetical protein